MKWLSSLWVQFDALLYVVAAYVSILQRDAGAVAIVVLLTSGIQMWRLVSGSFEERAAPAGRRWRALHPEERALITGLLLMLGILGLATLAQYLPLLAGVVAMAPLFLAQSILADPRRRLERE